MNNEQFTTDPQQPVFSTSEPKQSNIWHNGMYAASVLFVILALVIGGYTVAHRSSVATNNAKDDATVMNEMTDSESADLATVAQIDLGVDGLSPATVTTTPGATVTWKNTDTKAHVLSGDAVGDNTVNAGASVSYTFTEPGNYTVKDGSSTAVIRVRD